jgi:hypothetical protein
MLCKLALMSIDESTNDSTELAGYFAEDGSWVR